MKKEIKITNNTKATCCLCGEPTFLSLSVQAKETEDVDTICIPLCNRCMVKLLNNVYDKREDLVSDMLEEKVGLSLDKINNINSENVELQTKLEEAEDNIRSSYSLCNCSDDEETDEDY